MNLRKTLYAIALFCTPALAFAHPWLALIAVVGISVLLAVLVWWAWRKLSRGIRSLLQPSPAASLSDKRNE